MGKHYSPTQIHHHLNCVKDTSISQYCGANQVPEATFHSWKRKYGGMNLLQIESFIALEQENRALKKELKSSRKMLEASKRWFKEVFTTERRREIVKSHIIDSRMNRNDACELFSIETTTNLSYQTTKHKSEKQLLLIMLNHIKHEEFFNLETIYAAVKEELTDQFNKKAINLLYANIDAKKFKKWSIEQRVVHISRFEKYVQQDRILLSFANLGINLSQLLAIIENPLD
ncbi:MULTISPECIES: transposase [Pseudoalteromonas]|uniref:transposase n=1 Tax=Pseudoalteromonas TaxID=53246 RepID=UPI00165EE179|nr:MULTISPECIES: transposase [Pseudoalteromonas]MBD0411054.1 transposase [Pseudoalteromonas distincta]MCK8134693.1 transposase [Pseudoalteromonas sp. 2CM28B]